MKLSEIKALNQSLPKLVSSDDRQSINDYIRKMGVDISQIYQEMEMESRFVDAHRDVSFSNDRINLHSHTFHELLYCCNTCDVEYLVGADRYRLQKGDIILVPPGVSHRPLLPEQLTEPYKRYVLWISTEFLSKFMQAFPDEALFQVPGTRLIRTAGTKWDFLGDSIYQCILEAEKKDVGWEAVVAANTVRLVVHLRRAIMDRTAKTLKAEKPELMDQVLAYVEKHLARKITLSDVSRHFYVSESTISQTFRKKMGVSFHRCVTQRRLIAAKTLIGESIPLESVADRVGFSDYSAFYRAFKQEYGISPRQYRKIQENIEPL